MRTSTYITTFKANSVVTNKPIVKTYANVTKTRAEKLAQIYAHFASTEVDSIKAAK